MKEQLHAYFKLKFSFINLFTHGKAYILSGSRKVTSSRLCCDKKADMYSYGLRNINTFALMFAYSIQLYYWDTEFGCTVKK